MQRFAAFTSRLPRIDPRAHRAAVSMARTPCPASVGPPPPASAGANVVVLYHSPCNDGAYAALAASLYFQQGGGPQPRFVPHRTYAPTDAAALALTAADTVYLLDYAGPPGFAAELAERAGR